MSTVKTWLALNDLFTHPSMREELHEAFSDEDASLLIFHIYAVQDADSWKPEEFENELKIFLETLDSIVRREYSNIDPNEREKLVLQAVGMLIQNDAELRKLFSAFEYKKYLASLATDSSMELSPLTRVVGSYLTLRAFENVSPGFNVIRELFSVPV